MKTTRKSPNVYDTAILHNCTRTRIKQKTAPQLQTAKANEGIKCVEPVC